MSDYDAKSIPILDDVIDENLEDETEVIDLSNIEATADDSFDLFSDEFTASIERTKTAATETTPELGLDSQSTQPEVGNIESIIEQDDNIAVDATSPLAIEIESAPLISEISSTFNSDGNKSETLSLDATTHTVTAAITTATTDAFEDEATSTTESALIDYQADTSDEITIDAELNFDSKEDENIEVIPEITDVTPAEVPSLEPIFAIPKPEETLEKISLETLTDDIVKQIMPDLEQQLRHMVQQALADNLPETVVESSPGNSGQGNENP